MDEGDARDGKSFVSLPDEENPQYQKRGRSDYKFRRGVASRKDKPETIQQSKQAASSGYFLDDIEPHQIPLPSNSSDEIKDYDPEIYPEGTSLDIKEDEGDKDNIRSFVSMSDDERKKEQKEKRAEYKFRKRVAKKRKYGKKQS